MNGAAVANLARSVWGDLREKRLWPLALVLVVAVVAVPVLLMHSAAPTPAPAPLAASASAPPGVPAVGVQSSPGHQNLPGNGRDPFGHAPGATGAASATGATTTGSAVGGSASAHGANAGRTSSSAGSPTAGSGSTTPASVVTTPAPPGGAPPPPLPAPKPAPAPTGLSSLQSYQVSLSITNSAGGLNRVDSLERLGILPSAQQPLLVELGVLEGAHRVVFAVAPGTVLRGPGACVPGPLDCEILTLAPNQIESVAANVSSGAAAMFAITGITAANHPSQAAAQQARQAESFSGRQFLNQLPLQAVQLFPYDEGLGAVVDLRNLTVGG